MGADAQAGRPEHGFTQDGSRAFAGCSANVDDIEAALGVAQLCHQAAGALQSLDKLGLTFFRVIERFGGAGDELFYAPERLVQGVDVQGDPSYAR
jgi:hypothetical protein